MTQIHEWAADNDSSSGLKCLDLQITSEGGLAGRAGAPGLNLLTKGSEKHFRGQLRKSLDEHIADIHGQSILPRRSNFWSMSIWKIGRTVIGTAVIMSTELPKHSQNPRWCT
ncbi:MAG: hypothetical protein Ct9H300mP14_16450 [Gammaproteobacteria bacterium]|nr:MAG: hypothetical protein Ct9H300mP14_16450 [Gammaproteobacteria bacterium]